MTADRLVFYLALAFLAWWVVGAQWNRRRARTLVAAIRDALPALGRGGTFRPIGASAFRIDVGEPTGGLQAVSLVCLLEPRDFPLAWLWMRLRGHRDRIVVKARFTRDPEQVLAVERGDPRAREFGLARLIALRVQPGESHLHLAFGVGPGEERTEIPRAFELVRLLAGGAGAVS